MKGLNGFGSIERSKTSINTLIVTILAFGMGDITTKELMVELKEGITRIKEREKELVLDCFQGGIEDGRSRVSREIKASWQRALSHIKRGIRKSKGKARGGEN